MSGKKHTYKLINICRRRHREKNKTKQLFPQFLFKNHKNTHTKKMKVQ
jgi:hypothetical protein